MNSIRVTFTPTVGNPVTAHAVELISSPDGLIAVVVERPKDSEFFVEATSKAGKLTIEFKLDGIVETATVDVVIDSRGVFFPYGGFSGIRTETVFFRVVPEIPVFHLH